MSLPGQATAKNAASFLSSLHALQPLARLPQTFSAPLAHSSPHPLPCPSSSSFVACPGDTGGAVSPTPVAWQWLVAYIVGLERQLQVSVHANSCQ